LILRPSAEDEPKLADGLGHTNEAFIKLYLVSFDQLLNLSLIKNELRSPSSTLSLTTHPQSRSFSLSLPSKMDGFATTPNYDLVLHMGTFDHLPVYTLTRQRNMRIGLPQAKRDKALNLWIEGL
jgi:hypothetical protein